MANMDDLPWNFTIDGCLPEEEVDLSWIPRLLYSNSERIIITIINPIIFVLGLIGNLGFIYVIVRIPRMRTITNVYLTNLAIADVCFLALAVSNKLGRYFISPISGDHYPIGQIGCIFIFTFMNACKFASLYLLTMVTLEKYYAICKPYQHHAKFGGTLRSVKLAILGWTLAFSFACILMPAYWDFQEICIRWPESDYPVIPEEFGFCVPVAEWAVHIANGVQTFPFFIALIANFAMYYFIIRAMRQKSRAVAPNTLNPNVSFLQRTKTRHQLTRMIVINGIIFFICLAPFECISFSLMISNWLGKNILTQSEFAVLVHVCRILTYINAAINSFVYGVTNERYRKSFMTSLGGCNKNNTIHVRSLRDNGNIFTITKKNQHHDHTTTGNR